METRRFAHNETEVEKFRNDPDFTETGQDDNGNIIFHSKKIEDVLSKREKEVYDLKEKPNEVIAENLNISEKSVESYRKKIQSKGF